MGVKERFRQFLAGFGVSQKETAAAAAYNLWASDYDSQPNNLMLALDAEIFSELLSLTQCTNAIIADVGCGTGRYWQKLQQLQPQKLIGFDISEQMLVTERKVYNGRNTSFEK